MRFRLTYPDVETFIEKYAANVSKGGIFLVSRSPKPVGTLLRFEMLLSDSTPLIRGEGKVVWVKEFDATNPGKPHGMGVKFTRMDSATKAMIERLVAFKLVQDKGSATEQDDSKESQVETEAKAGTQAQTASSVEDGESPAKAEPTEQDAAAKEQAAPDEQQTSAPAETDTPREASAAEAPRHPKDGAVPTSKEPDDALGLDPAGSPLLPAKEVSVPYSSQSSGASAVSALDALLPGDVDSSKVKSTLARLKLQKRSATSVDIDNLLASTQTPPPRASSKQDPAASLAALLGRGPRTPAPMAKRTDTPAQEPMPPESPAQPSEAKEPARLPARPEEAEVSRETHERVAGEAPERAAGSATEQAPEAAPVQAPEDAPRQAAPIISDVAAEPTASDLQADPLFADQLSNQQPAERKDLANDVLHASAPDTDESAALDAAALSASELDADALAASALDLEGASSGELASKPRDEEGEAGLIELDADLIEPADDLVEDNLY
ncbi:MAG: TIGR02266 family protein, partial [Polyangia bacterium]|nr:TIGR02266 family protein [Polyangia bacterium]